MDYYRINSEAISRGYVAQIKREMEYKQEEKKKNDRVLELIIKCLSLHKQYYEELINTQKRIEDLTIN